MGIKYTLNTGSAVAAASHSQPVVSASTTSDPYIRAKFTLNAGGALATHSYVLPKVSAASPGYFTVTTLKHPAFINSVSTAEDFLPNADYVRVFDEALTGTELLVKSIAKGNIAEALMAADARAIDFSAPKTEAVTTSESVVRLITFGRVATDTATTSEVIVKSAAKVLVDTGTTSEVLVKSTSKVSTDTATTSEGVAKVVTFVRAVSDTATTSELVSVVMDGQRFFNGSAFNSTQMD